MKNILKLSLLFINIYAMENNKVEFLNLSSEEKILESSVENPHIVNLETPNEDKINKVMKELNDLKNHTYDYHCHQIAILENKIRKQENTIEELKAYTSNLDGKLRSLELFINCEKSHEENNFLKIKENKKGFRCQII